MTTNENLTLLADVISRHRATEKRAVSSGLGRINNTMPFSSPLVRNILSDHDCQASSLPTASPFFHRGVTIAESALQSQTLQRISQLQANSATLRDPTPANLKRTLQPNDQLQRLNLLLLPQRHSPVEYTPNRPYLSRSEKELRRKLANRRSARESRVRRKKYFDALKTKATELANQKRALLTEKEALIKELTDLRKLSGRRHSNEKQSTETVDGDKQITDGINSVDFTAEMDTKPPARTTNQSSVICASEAETKNHQSLKDTQLGDLNDKYPDAAPQARQAPELSSNCETDRS